MAGSRVRLNARRPHPKRKHTSLFVNRNRKPGAPHLPHPRMSRDQRMRDNWALLHALEQAGKKGAPAAVAFNLVGHRAGGYADACHAAAEARPAAAQCSGGWGTLFGAGAAFLRPPAASSAAGSVCGMSKSLRSPLATHRGAATP